MVCPVCGDSHLSIERELAQPDQMSCKACATNFEVAQDGETVRLVRYPDHLPAELRAGWFKPSTIRQIAFQSPKHEFPQSAPVVVDIPLEERVIRLIRLGNSPDKIREILSRQPGVMIGQVDEILDNFKKQSGNNRSSTWMVVLGGLVVILVIGVIAALLFQPSPPANPAGTTNSGGANTLQPNASSTQASSPYLDPALLPAPLQTLIPSGMAILKPTPVVVQALDANTQPAIRCPVSPGQAAEVFGGEMKDWNKNTTGGAGWFMVSAQSRTVHLPKNMTGGYFVFSNSPSMESVTGPAIIENVFFVSISCE